MSKRLVLYSRSREARKGEDYKGVEIVTVPNQSMSLKQIIQRFVKKQPLAIEKEGFYDDSGIDYEKFQRAEFAEQEEYVELQRSRVNTIRDVLAKREVEEKAKAEADKEALSQKSKEPAT